MLQSDTAEFPSLADDPHAKISLDMTACFSTIGLTRVSKQWMVLGFFFTAFRIVKSLIIF